jgi:hypothetical protein
MRIHQQRVPIISPLDKDYYRSALSTSLSADKFADEYDLSNDSLSSMGADRSRLSIGRVMRYKSPILATQ